MRGNGKRDEMASDKSIQAMAEQRVVLQGAYCIDPHEAAEVADRLVAEAEAALREHILTALGPEDPGIEMGATVGRVFSFEFVRSIVMGEA